jgi:hypothetical protein
MKTPAKDPAPRRRKASREVFELVDLSVSEVSLVDSPAIGRTFAVVKSAEKRRRLHPAPAARKTADEKRREAELEAAGVAKRTATRKLWLRAVSEALTQISAKLEAAKRDVAELKKRKLAKAAARPMTREQVVQMIKAELDAQPFRPLFNAFSNGHGGDGRTAP